MLSDSKPADQDWVGLRNAIKLNTSTTGCGRSRGHLNFLGTLLNSISEDRMDQVAKLKRKSMVGGAADCLDKHSISIRIVEGEMLRYTVNRCSSYISNSSRLKNL